MKTKSFVGLFMNKLNIYLKKVYDIGSLTKKVNNSRRGGKGFLVFKRCFDEVIGESFRKKTFNGMGEI